MGMKCIYIKDLESNESLSFSSLTECYNFLGITEGRFRSYMYGKNYLKYRLGKYSIRPNTDIDYPDLTIDSPDYPKGHSKEVEIKNLHTNEIIPFNSAIDCGKYLGIKGPTISNALRMGYNTKFRYGDWIIRSLDQPWPNITLRSPQSGPNTHTVDIQVQNKSTKGYILYPSIISAAEGINIHVQKVARGIRTKGIFENEQYIVKVFNPNAMMKEFTSNSLKELAR